MSVASVRRALYARLRRLFLGGYYRLVHQNYDREVLATRQRTLGGTVRSYELYNRHGRDEMLAAVESHCGPESVVYDVGANVGVYALALAAGEPDRRIVAVEPAPTVADQLTANVRVNGFGDRIAVRRCGLGDESGERDFYVSTYTELSGFDRASASRWEASVAAVEPVQVDRLDDLVAETSPPDVVKIDVEGGGASVLRGGRDTLERHRPTIVLEPHSDGLDGTEPTACRTLLTDAEYEITERDDFWVAEPATSP
ncbi:FkbM family methyltransferase [Natrarchaeobius oligotrophus]|uniref:FkbM family methyltransferase n=1 Tax=Natrarchaeobius chitinivorans TaxID=1679083 RepID=A0A3N6PKZ0_NATCH|nr:FkbM family methyltransferase [Natrarchaeobius chitinivorans]RQH02020.1 FkbM family methyltransferase [Natrarchaeobius chitinivorans]